LGERLRRNADCLDFVPASLKRGFRLTKHGNGFLKLLLVLRGVNPHKSSDGANFWLTLARRSGRKSAADQQGSDDQKAEERTKPSAKKRMHVPLHS
jgi:hypothetical protein